MPLISLLFEKFNYYDKPDGEDPVGKIMGLAKFGMASGGFLGLYDAVVYSQCQNALQFFNTFSYWALPMTNMCVAFSAVTYVSTVLRKKDDCLNYALGALASGTILHHWQRCWVTTGLGLPIMVLLAVLKKDTKLNNYTQKNLFIPDKVPIKWLCSWRNVPYRNYTSKPKYPHDRTSYYLNFY